MHDILIIGGGFAGLTASLYALRADKKVLLIEKDSFGGQIANSPLVENYPTIESISGLELADKLFSQIENKVDIELDEILKVEKKDNYFVASGKYKSYQAKSLIIATGAKHKKLNVENEDKFLGKGISYCAVCDGAFFTNKIVGVIGDANSALQYAILLSQTAKKVYIFTLFDKFFGENHLIENLIRLNNVEIVHNVNTKRFLGSNSLEGIEFEDTLNNKSVTYNLDGAFIAIGQEPDNKKFENLVKLDKGFIVVDENMACQTEGVFAAGDCINKKIRQLVTASSDGAIASLSAINYLSKN